MKNFKTECIILKYRNIFEKDRLLTVFSRDNGIIRILAKGANSSKFRFGSRIEPLSHVTLNLGKGKSFYYCQQVDLLNPFSDIRSNYNSMSLAFYCCDLILHSTVQGQGNSTLFDVLLSTFSMMASDSDLVEIKQYFCINFLKSEGVLLPTENRVSDHEFNRLFQEYTGSSVPEPLFINTFA